MEEQEPAGNIDNPEAVLPSLPSPPTDVHEETDSATRYSLEAEAKRPALAQRLTEVFREGVASAGPDYDQRPDAGIPPRTRKNRQEASEAGIRDRVTQEVGSAVAAVGDKAAGVLGGFVQLIKKAPALTQKYAEAYREGAASVKQQAGRERPQERPRAAKANGAPADGRAIFDRVIKAGESAAGFVREAVSVVKPGEVIGVRQKIRRGEKKINQLYLDIGGEVASSWSDGLVETEKLAALLDELRQNEEAIQNLQAHLAEVAAASKPAAARSPKTVKKEAAFTPTPPTDQEDSRVDTVSSGAPPDEPVEHLDNAGFDQPLIDDPGEGALPEPEDIPDIVPDGVDLSLPVEPDSEAPASLFVSEDQVDAEAAPQEGSDGGAEPALPEEPDLKQEKKTGAKKDKKGRGNDG